MTDPTRLDCFDALLGATLQMRRHLETVADSFGLTPPQARVIANLPEPVRMQAVADATGCEPSHLTAIASSLEDLGLARRETDPSDRRARRLALTPKGEALRVELVPTLVQNSPILTHLDDAEAATLLDLLRR
ncbi:MarR family winged helix-turn-helix transcriptional regulator [Janibacter sp. GXQ6167]|uniref:MarR family winged helix-turn-helix transcriptional regulator n=1 Tax=Janibacter sp. GXQ6167 TaxID=3240791 RepID=UPI003523C44F